MKVTKLELEGMKNELFTKCVQLSESRNELEIFSLNRIINRLTETISNIEIEEEVLPLSFIDIMFMGSYNTGDEIVFDITEEEEKFEKIVNQLKDIKENKNKYLTEELGLRKWTI